MKFKIFVGNQSAEIEEDEIPKVLEAVENGSVIVFKHIIFNPSYFEAIVRNFELEREAVKNKRMGIEENKTSDFAKLIDMQMLPPDKRDQAMVEASTQTRKVKIKN